MAQALVGGLIQAGHRASRIRVADPSASRRESLEQELGVRCFESNAETLGEADAIVLAVKPQVMAAVLADLAAALAPETTVISVAAGVTLDGLARGLGEKAPIVRAMPNTPALYQAGISGLVANGCCDAESRALAEWILGAAGEIVWIEKESQMDAVTAISGSGPAYYFAFTEHLAEAGIRAGLAPEIAARLARQTAIGAGQMLSESSLDPGELRRRVTSPGGTTEAALRHFAAAKLASMIEQAVDAAVKRGQDLGAS